MRHARIALLALCAAGCAGGDGGGGVGGEGPAPVLTVEEVFSISGTGVIERGECVGFRLRTENFDVAAPSVRFSYYEIEPSFLEVVDETTVQVGLPCFVTGLDLPMGPTSVALIEDGRTVIASGVFDVVETTRLEIGDAPASSAALADGDANELGVAHDFDVYEWAAPADGFFLAEVVLSTGADPAFLPYSFVAWRNLGRWWNGHELVLVPADAGDYLAQIADHAVGGAATGYGYVFEVSPLPAPAALDAAETCDSGADAAADGFWLVDLARASDDLDPGGALTCADRHAPLPVVEHDGVAAPGPDRVLRLVVSSGATLAVAARGASTDVALYLVPDESAGCAGAVDPCLAASDTFGASDTETLLWTNAGPDRSVFLVIDDYAGPDSSAGEIELLLRTTE